MFDGRKVEDAMRTHLEFRSADLQRIDADRGSQGAGVAEMLAAGLPCHGFELICVIEEDWGWCLKLENAAFPLWIGCGHYEEFADGHLCFIEPSKPYVRRWFMRIATGAVVEALARAVEALLGERDDVYGVRWWTEAETRIGMN